MTSDQLTHNLPRIHRLGHNECPLGRAFQQIYMLNSLLNMIRFYSHLYGKYCIHKAEEIVRFHWSLARLLRNIPVLLAYI
uniref:Uncharacterized protein n=1 Tax=Acrobeloides nanus TaxID=290746 RepID=A0A914EQ01_9BILA